MFTPVYKCRRKRSYATHNIIRSQRYDNTRYDTVTETKITIGNEHKLTIGNRYEKYRKWQNRNKRRNVQDDEILANGYYNELTKDKLEQDSEPNKLAH